MAEISPEEFRMVADKLALNELVARLEHAVDRKDRQGIIDCYSEKSFDDHGRFRGTREEFADFVCNNPAFTAASPFMVHVMGQSIWDIEGDEAFGESYFDYYMQVEENKLYKSIGRYLDYCERTADGWRITYRRIVMEWDGQLTAERAVYGGHYRSTRDENDPSYKKLRWPENPEWRTSTAP